MSILKRMQRWWYEQDFKRISEFTKYKLIITLVDGEIIEAYHDKYYHNLKSFTSYYMTINEKGILISGKFYPIHMIRSIEDEPIRTELIYQEDEYFGIWGLSYNEIKKNQSKWKHLIDEYKFKNSI